MGDYNLKQEVKRDLVFIILILFIFIGGIAIYPYLPETIAIHWNLRGEADNSINRLYAIFLLPLIGLAVYIYNITRPLYNSREPLDRLRKNRRMAVVIITMVQIGIIVINL